MEQRILEENDVECLGRVRVHLALLPLEGSSSGVGAGVCAEKYRYSDASRVTAVRMLLSTWSLGSYDTIDMGRYCDGVMDARGSHTFEDVCVVICPIIVDVKVTGMNWERS